MTRQARFAQMKKTDDIVKPVVEETTPAHPAAPAKHENHTPPSNPREAFRNGLAPEPTPGIGASPLTAPKIDKDYSTIGIAKEPVTPAQPPPPPNAPTVGALPPPIDDDPPLPAPAGPPSPPEKTADAQSFTPPSTTVPGGDTYTMPGNYAKRTAEDIFNGANYFLKWTVAPWLYVPRKREFIRFEKATKRMAEISPTVKPSKINERLETQNAKTRDTMALDDEDRELFVPAFSAWFHESGFHLSPGGRAAMAAGQIALRKLGDVGKIRRENKEFLAELEVEVGRFLKVYDEEIKPALDEAQRTQKPVQPPPPPPPENKEPPVNKDNTAKQ